MNYRTFILVILCWVILLPVVNSQVFDQAKLFRLLPAMPTNLSTATDEEISAFTAKCDSVNNILSGYENVYKRKQSGDDPTNSDLIMEYLDIRDTILDLHSTERNKYYDLFTLFSDLEYELSAKNDLIKESIGNLKNEGNKEEEIKVLNDEIYANRVECSKKQVAIYLQFLKDYRDRLNNIAEKSNKSEVIPLPDHLNKDVSYVILNVKKYLGYLSDAYRFNVGQNIPEE
ncbi:MAG: hypothetical protein ACM3PX_01235 [Omnitrophica WOR_2 bacterium]